MAEGKIGKRYTPEEAADMIMNDDLREMDSADSLDNESTGSDPSEISSRSDNDSDPDIDFCGRQVYPDTAWKNKRTSENTCCTRYSESAKWS